MKLFLFLILFFSLAWPLDQAYGAGPWQPSYCSHEEGGRCPSSKIDRSWGRSHFAALQVFYPLESKAKLYLSSIQYAFTLNSWFDPMAALYLGRFSLQGGASFLHQNPLKKEGGNPLESPWPYLADLALKWEGIFLPYITPFFTVGLSWYNPFKREDMQDHLGLGDKTRMLLFSAGLLLSFNVFDPAFSIKMENEYSISDMGVMLEWRRYGHSFKKEHTIQEGFAFFALYSSF